MKTQKLVPVFGILVAVTLSAGCNDKESREICTQLAKPAQSELETVKEQFSSVKSDPGRKQAVCDWFNNHMKTRFSKYFDLALVDGNKFKELYAGSLTEGTRCAETRSRVSAFFPHDGQTIARECKAGDESCHDEYVKYKGSDRIEHVPDGGSVVIATDYQFETFCFRQENYTYSDDKSLEPVLSALNSTASGQTIFNEAISDICSKDLASAALNAEVDHLINAINQQLSPAASTLITLTCTSKQILAPTYAPE